MIPHELEKAWAARASLGPLLSAPTFAGDRLMLGAQTEIAVAGRRSADGEARMIALLSAAYSAPVSDRALAHLRRALERQAEGDALLSSTHLALAGYWPLRDPLAAAKRVFFSDGLTRCGAAPAMILAALDLDPRRLDGLERFDPAQPRVPAGNGVESGRWTSDGGATGGNEVAVGDEPRSDEDSLFSENLPARVVQGLIRLAARSSVPSIVFDTLFVPSAGKSGVTEGDVPGRTGLQYSWDKPAGQVLSRVFIDGHWVTLTGGRDNLNQFYRDADGNVIARAAGDALVVDLGSLDRARERLAEGSGGQPPSDPSSREPKLCPDKSREDITGRSEAALAYQEYVSGLPREFIIEFNGVEYDGCDQLTGLLKEGKGNYAHLLTKDGTWQDWASDSRDDIQNQIMRQSKAAALSGRRVAWYVQQNPVANIFREWVNDLGITNIDVYYDPGP
jgi:hypothetical protein